MIWNFIMHTLIGVLGTTFFHFTPKGIAFAVILTVATQGVDLIRLYRDKLKILENKPMRDKLRTANIEAFKREFKEELPKLYLRNVGIFTLVVIFAAELGRYYRIGV
ncbi:MAG: hypothetical protein GY721_02730 [Deltaproteobacteria bacterium]|nr:hypothetical protein [Deltaproteobacteria bacterium]